METIVLYQLWAASQVAKVSLSEKTTFLGTILNLLFGTKFEEMDPNKVEDNYTT